MSRLMRPLRQWPQLQQNHHCSSRATLNYLLSSLLPLPTTTAAAAATQNTTSFCLSLTSSPSSHRNVHHRARGLRHSNSPPPSDSDEDDASSSDSDSKKSRNQRKREARLAVRWGMQLAAFSTPQIKRILKVILLDDDVLEALMLVKRLGPDVKEGKRRQFNYIGKLLREVEPELMETLIQATKAGDHSTLQALAASKMQIARDDDVETEETENEEKEEVSHEYINIATSWFDGLINNDVKITKEVYSVQSVDFDRQELRKLVKRVHASQESWTIAEVNEGEIAEVNKGEITEGNEGELDAAIVSAKKRELDAAIAKKRKLDAAIVAAKKSLNHFLLTLAKRMVVNDA
ncbi:hypothetical protein EZV62_021217 [Acer yangbiense]|uniref:Uncharacterized protein n=1 Tax=Acer yangbiense TaxID=1000413 RepID=A0A5C7H4W4_9ROSI|nr:hypothetical protein EZV62_021217 [Acer yangbiense]